MTVAPTPTDSTLARRDRYRNHHWLRTNSVRKGARLCMCAKGENVAVGVTKKGVTHFKGVKRCGSVKACPLCMPVIATNRARILDGLFHRALEDGCILYMVSAKVQHFRSMALSWSVKGIGHAWSRTFSGKAAQEKGYIGQSRAWDFTYGRNGWHPHIHAVLVFKPGSDRAVIEEWLTKRGESYVTRLADKKLSAALDDRGWHFEECRSAEASAKYLVKVNDVVDADDNVIEHGWGAAAELLRPDLKRGKRGSVNPWALLSCASWGGVQAEEAAILWREYETVTKKIKSVVTGRKLAKLYGPDANVEDEELAAAEVEEALVLVVDVPWRMWNNLVKRGRLCEFLEGLVIEAAALEPPGLVA